MAKRIFEKCSITMAGQATQILNDASAAIINAKLMTTGIKAVEDKIGEMRRLLEVMNHTAERIRKAVTP